MVTAALIAIGLFPAGTHHPAAHPGDGAVQCRGRALHLHPRAGVPDALHGVDPDPLDLPAARRSGLERIPDEGPAVLVCNHVSFVDALVICGGLPPADPLGDGSPHLPDSPDELVLSGTPKRSRSRRPARIRRCWKRPTRASTPRSPTATSSASSRRGASPTPGRCTRSSKAWRESSNAIPVPVIPMALRGLWGSFFSRFGGAAFSRPLDARLRRGLRSRVEFIVGEPVPADQASPELLMQRVAELRGSHR